MEGKLLIIYLLFIGFISIKSIDESTVAELVKALERARAGQIIAIAPGVYDLSEMKENLDFLLNQVEPIQDQLH